jgi:glucokinase
LAVARWLQVQSPRRERFTITPAFPCWRTTGRQQVLQPLQAIDQVFGKAVSSGTYDASLRGIGICCPGPLDPHTGIVINPPNLPCWRNFPLADEISRKYKVPVKVDNDANGATLAEALWGAGRGYRNIFLTVLGTGIGTGIVFDGRIYHGRTGAAGEGGHVSIDYRGPLCGCGKAGCIEALASGPAIAKHAQAKLSANGTRESVLLRLAQGQARRRLPPK